MHLFFPMILPRVSFFLHLFLFSFFISFVIQDETRQDKYCGHSRQMYVCCLSHSLIYRSIISSFYSPILFILLSSFIHFSLIRLTDEIHCCSLRLIRSLTEIVLALLCFLLLNHRIFSSFSERCFCC